MASQPLSSSRPQLRLYAEGEDGSSGNISVEMTLPEFFWLWFLENVLRAKETKEGTFIVYKNAVAWWERLMGPLPLRLIDQATINEFRRRLREATYRRGTAGATRKLAVQTIPKHLSSIRALIRAMGPRLVPSRPAAELLEKLPLVAVCRPRSSPKEHFTLGQTRQMVHWSQLLTGEAAPGVPESRFWPGYYASLFFTGVRKRTGLMLEWKWLKERKGKIFLDIPDVAVPKTDKGKSIIVHPNLLQAWEPLRVLEHERITPWDRCGDGLLDAHYAIQEQAGILLEYQLDLQALRRTFANQLMDLGADVGTKLAQEGLDHSDARTTVGHYVTLNRVIPRMPPIYFAAVPSPAAMPPGPRQGLLF